MILIVNVSTLALAVLDIMNKEDDDQRKMASEIIIGVGLAFPMLSMAFFSASDTV